MLQSDWLSYWYTIDQPLECSSCRSSTKCDVFIVFSKFWKKV